MNASYGTLDRTVEVDELHACLPRRRSSNRIGLGVVLALEMLEGLAIYSIIPYVVTFCRDDLKFTKTEAIIIYLSIGAILYMLPCVSGALGDAIFTRFTCILASLVVFLVGGLVMLSLAVVMSQEKDVHLSRRSALYVVSLIFVGVGYGCTISNKMPFGIDQLAGSDLSPRNMWSFFIWKHWFHCLGKFLSYLPLPCILKAVDKETVLLPKAVVVVVAVGLAVGILLLGKPWINIVQPQGKTMFRRLKNGFSRCLPCFCRESFDYVSLESTASLTNERRVNRRLLKNVILLSALFSVFSTFSIFHAQLTSTFVLQAEMLHNASQLPVISMNAFGPIVVLLGVPLFEVHNRFKRHWKNLTNLDIMLMGAIPLAFAATAAAILETYIRKNDSGISLWAQTPQYVLFGLADLLSYIPATEFAYKESPTHIEGFISGMLFSAGSVMTLMVFIVEVVTFTKYVPHKKVIQFEYHFYTLFGTIVFIFIFVMVPFVHIYRSFKERVLNDTEAEERLLEVTCSLETI